MDWPITGMKPKEPDPEKIGGRQDQIALKYLDIARAEILDRMKASNQTLTVYVGGVGAIVGWMYQAASKDHANMRTLVFPTGVIVAFLALAATWIIFHNERMVNALARYQKTLLAPYFKSVAPGMIAWESSDALHDTDDRLSIAATIIVQAILIIGPSLVFLTAMVYFVFFHPVKSVLEGGALVLEVCLISVAITFTGFTIWHRRKLRKEPR